MQPTKTRQAITQKRFYTISRAIKGAVKANSYNANELAKWFGISPETVRAVRRAGTWPQFIRDKQARRARVVGKTAGGAAETEMTEHLSKLNGGLVKESMPVYVTGLTLEQRVSALEDGLKAETKRAVLDVSEVYARVGRLDRALREVKEVLPGRWLRRLDK